MWCIRTGLRMDVKYVLRRFSLCCALTSVGLPATKPTMLAAWHASRSRSDCSPNRTAWHDSSSLSLSLSGR